MNQHGGDTGEGDGTKWLIVCRQACQRGPGSHPSTSGTGDATLAGSALASHKHEDLEGLVDAVGVVAGRRGTRDASPRHAANVATQQGADTGASSREGVTHSGRCCGWLREQVLQDRGSDDNERGALASGQGPCAGDLVHGRKRADVVGAAQRASSIGTSENSSKCMGQRGSQGCLHDGVRHRDIDGGSRKVASGDGCGG